MGNVFREGLVKEKGLVFVYISTLECVCFRICVFITLHITALPGPDMLIFQFYTYGFISRGIGGVWVVLVCDEYYERF